MKKEPLEPEDRIREEFKENIKKTLSERGQRRWNLLEELALEHGYLWEEAYSYRLDNNYLMKVGGTVAYAEDVNKQLYQEIKRLLEQKGRIQTSPSLISNALAIGGSTLGGAFLGFLLIRVGLHPLVLVPSIIVPPGLCIYDMLKQSAKESDKLARIQGLLNKYQEHLYFDDDAVKRFCYRIYKSSLADMQREGFSQSYKPA
ncbi:MAG: hypothetical protein ACOC6B_03585 [Thermodesulfobacteriota bacterium]